MKIIFFWFQNLNNISGRMNNKSENIEERLKKLCINTLENNKQNAAQVK